VLFTHEHADHTHGLDDIRAITNRRAAPLTMYGSREALDRLSQRFPYIFDDNMRVLPGTTKPEGRAEALASGVTVKIGDAMVTPVAVPHGRVTVFAYRIDDLAYVTDAKSIPSEAMAVLRGARVLVINALFRTEHPSHLSLSEAINAAREIGAARTYLTHLTHDNFHADLEAELPRDIQPAFDGLTVRI
jgi:phosphoribosyl 1,2-cyclic phosphate phosphodiesterase